MRHGIHFFLLWFPICIFWVTVEKSDFHQISAVVPNILLLYKRMSFCTEETNWHLKREFCFRWQGANTETDETTPKDKKEQIVCIAWRKSVQFLKTTHGGFESTDKRTDLQPKFYLAIIDVFTLLLKDLFEEKPVGWYAKH